MDFKKMRENPKAKEAQSLSIGDIVHSAFGYMAVVSRPGYSPTPRKCEITFKYLDGRHEGLTTKKTWGKTTPIRVEGNMNDTVENPSAPSDNVQAMDGDQLMAIVDNGKNTPLSLEDCIHVLNIEPNNYMHKQRLADVTGWHQMNVNSTVGDVLQAFEVKPSQLGIIRKMAKIILDRK